MYKRQVDDPEGTEALPNVLQSKITSTSTVGNPLLSNISLDLIFFITGIVNYNFFFVRSSNSIISLSKIFKFDNATIHAPSDGALSGFS